MKYSNLQELKKEWIMGERDTISYQSQNEEYILLDAISMKFWSK